MRETVIELCTPDYVGGSPGGHEGYGIGSAWSFDDAEAENVTLPDSISNCYVWIDWVGDLFDPESDPVVKLTLIVNNASFAAEKASNDVPFLPKDDEHFPISLAELRRIIDDPDERESLGIKIVEEAMKKFQNAHDCILMVDEKSERISVKLVSKETKEIFMEVSQ